MTVFDTNLSRPHSLMVRVLEVDAPNPHRAACLAYDAALERGDTLGTGIQVLVRSIEGGQVTLWEFDGAYMLLQEG